MQMEECNEAPFYVPGPLVTDIACHRSDARERDDELTRARYAIDWNNQFELPVEPELAKEYHDESFCPDNCKWAEFC